MSTDISYIVDSEATLEEAPRLAERVVAELLRRGIILPTPQVHETIGQGPPYATGPNVAQAANHNDGFPCGLDVEIGRAVYTPGSNGLDALACPECGQQFGPADIDWASAVGNWFEGQQGPLGCANCERSTSVSEWQFTPVWGFG